jgi:hypothetical protein
MSTRTHLFPQTSEKLALWRADPEVLGVVLVGSKSRGHDDDKSDDDIEVLLTDEAAARIAPADCLDVLVRGEGKERRVIYDAQLTSLSALVAKRHSTFDLDHWPYERAEVLFERDPRVREAVGAAGAMPAAFRALRLKHATIDAWIAPYRAEKTFERGFTAAGRLLVARGARALARIVFALENRWVPLDHWLEPELASLADASGVGPMILVALRTGNPKPIDTALAGLEDRLAAEGVARADGRRALFLELIHPSNAAERAVHGLPS